MYDIIEQLHERSETVPVPLELPEFDQLVQAEEELLIPLPTALKEYLLYASDVVVGTLEPVTVADPHSHTFLPEVTSYAWSIGMPREYIAICQQSNSFYCIDQEGVVRLWSEDELESEMWESFWQWAEDVWLHS